jgi:Protein of unknown function (DUF3455)
MRGNGSTELGAGSQGQPPSQETEACGGKRYHRHRLTCSTWICSKLFADGGIAPCACTVADWYPPHWPGQQAPVFWISFAGQRVPKQLQPPAGERLFLQVHAKGDQVYICKNQGAEFSWALKAPDARLFKKDGKPFGKHFAGPSWEANDGSRVTGKAVANEPSPKANSIPWLLITVVSHEGRGVLSRATSIQRVNTHGGQAPKSGCDSHIDREIRGPYSADYRFYSK